MLAEDQLRLQKIDQLYDLRLDQYVSLPQLVVTGDQSSGKSSVLEALTGLPFPRDSGLCTRFPTQIVFKRSRTSSIEASIMTAHGQADEKVDAIAKFGKMRLETLDQDTFSNILEKASKCMSLPLPGQQRHNDMEAFSDNILKFELSGPDHEHFSVVDLPGLFRTPTPGQTSKEDIPIVRQMVARYLKNPRSIILAVVPANVDIATQEIIQMAEDADPKGQRTLGVLTKPDLVDKGAEDKVMELVANTPNKTRFKLGYAIVCNRSQIELHKTFDARNERERAFFAQHPWNILPPDRVGIKTLKSRLDKLLVDITRQNFQGVIVDIQKMISKVQSQLDVLGPPRQTVQEQRNHLINISSRFRDIATKAIDAYYRRDSCFENDHFRLATLVTNMNEVFSQTIHEKGFTRPFGTRQSEPKSNSEAMIKPEMEPPSDDHVDIPTPSTPGIELSELESIIPRLEPPLGKKSKDIMNWIKHEYSRSKGFEIGTINPSLMPALFKEQSQAWNFYAHNHVIQIIHVIHRFNFRTLEYCCDDDRISERMWKKLIEHLLPSYEKALQQVSFLVDIEHDGNLLTLNHYFADNVQKSREERLRAKFQMLKSWETGDQKREPLLLLSDIINVCNSNDDHTIQDLHDTLKSYYKVARKRFVDAVCLQAVDYFLVCGKTSPLWIFSPQFVGNLSDSELNEIVGDNDEVQMRREQLLIELESLSKGEKILAT